jgi:hypothetical protein
MGQPPVDFRPERLSGETLTPDILIYKQAKAEYAKLQ